MTREDIEKELDIIKQRINNADEYFKHKDLIEQSMDRFRKNREIEKNLKIK